MKVYFNPTVSVYGNNHKKSNVNTNKGVVRCNYVSQPDSYNRSSAEPSFGATFFKTVAKHISLGMGSGAAVGANIGGAVDLGSLGTTLGVPTATGTAVGTAIGGVGGAITGTINYFVDKHNEAAQKKLEEANRKLEKEKEELAKKQKALEEQEAAATKKNNEALERQRKEIEEKTRILEILKSYNTKELNEKKGVGIGKIAGYAEDKAALNELFISPYRKSFEDVLSDVHIPNGILLYGLSGNGKTTLAQGMIEELMKDTNTKFYDMSDTSRKDLQEKLSKIKEEAEAEFNENGRRTLILMDEFDGIAPNPGQLTKLLKGDEAENSSNAYLKNFMNDCSDYGITVIATTNYPQNIERPFIINNKRFEVKTVIEPPNANDMYQILEYYLDGVTEGEIDYNEAVNLLMHNVKSKNAKYSCSCIKLVADKAKSFAKKEQRLVTQDDILKFADKVKPDLGKNYMDTFNEDFEFVTGSTYEEYLEEKKQKRKQESDL